MPQEGEQYMKKSTIQYQMDSLSSFLILLDILIFKTSIITFDFDFH
ncbi:MAG: hypothetical protein ACJAT4_001380 [Granulosicoccus sp.]|jgi:hypothetical protein